jgi:inner membrane protein
MQKALLFKLLAILALTILICIPIGIINDTISERSKFREQAVDSVSAESVREQSITGPILVVPYTDDYEETVTSTDATVPTKVVKHSVQRRHLVFPDQLTINGKIETYRRYRGIHQVLMYSGVHDLAGDFTMPPAAQLARESAKSVITVGRPYLALGISDVRGIRAIPKVNWNGALVEFQQGTAMSGMRSGMHAVPEPLAPGAKASFSFKLELDGIERQHFVPVGKNNLIKLQSNWPHPQFGGLFLPSPDRTIGDQGFAATWSISSLATAAQQQLRDNEAASLSEQRVQLDQFGVAFIEPVNVYSLAERATKYGLMFVALTFAAFFMFEVLKMLPIHPVQYLLVGLALALFFLLLVSLSEHIAFALAYLIASGACIVLIGFYLSSVLRDWRRGMGFGAALTLLYGALYGLLISESNALVMGSVLLFAILSAVMVATRKVDWYQIGKSAPATA